MPQSRLSRCSSRNSTADFRKFIDAITKITPDDPTDPDTFLGPLASADAGKELEELVEDAVAKGATLHIAPGARREGAFYPPSVLTGVTPPMRAYEEELFGPTAVVYRVPSPQAAVALANESPFGLSSSVFTQDPVAAAQIARLRAMSPLLHSRISDRARPQPRQIS